MLAPDSDIDGLVKWVRSVHRKDKHAVIMINQYDIVDLVTRLRSNFTGVVTAGMVDFIVQGKWVCARPMLDSVPAYFMKDSKVNVIMVSP